MEQRAYHGTSLENAKKICKSSNEINFKISCGENEWLGNGVYFFDNKQDARDWSKKVRRFEEIGIVSAVITADEDKMLNLISNDNHIKLFTNTLNTIKQKSEKYKDKNINTNYTALAIKILIEKIKYDVIKAIFKPDKRLKEKIQDIPNNMLIGRIQICVINTNCISNCNIIME